jgi:hypothetical protein
MIIHTYIHTHTHITHTLTQKHTHHEGDGDGGLLDALAAAESVLVGRLKTN